MTALRSRFSVPLSVLLGLAACSTPAPEPVAEEAAASAGAGSEAAVAADGEVKDMEFFLRRLTDLDRLAVLEEGVRTAQFSSYDRRSRYDETTGKYESWDANADSGHYLRVDSDTGEGVMAEIAGPGCIWRIWSANPTGRIRFYFDGAAEPGLEMNFKELFQGGKPPFVPPLVWQRAVHEGGDNPASVCYVPIPFAKSCRVTADEPHKQYYHIGYSTFPETWAVETFNTEMDWDRRIALHLAVKALSEAGTNPGRPAGKLSVKEAESALKPGETVVLGLFEGAGVLREFRAKLLSPERWAARKVLLRMYWDGEEDPSVEAPLGDFFGDPWQEAPYRSLPMGITEDMNYSYWRMPFQEGARVVAINQGDLLATLRYRLVVDKTEPAENAARFHAKWRRDRDGDTFDYPLLECTGRGRFVGAALFPDNLVGGWWGEGDEKVYVDGEKFPSTFGTGSEDYFGDAWGIRFFVNPYHGCPTPVSREAARRQSCYRWHISDDIPFEQSYRMTIENYSALGEGPLRNDYSSVAYWYQMPGGADFFQSAGVDARIPRGVVVTGAMEAEDLLVGEPPKGVKVVSDEALPEELSSGSGLWISGAPGSSVTLRVPSGEDGDFTVEVVTARGLSHSPFEVVKDGETVGYRTRLEKGDNEVSIRLVGNEDPGKVVIDYLLLHPYRNFVREWYVIGPFPNEGDAGLDRPYPPEDGPLDLEAVYDGKSGDVRWHKVVVPSGVVDGTTLFDDLENLVAYGYCELRSPDARRVTGLVGSDDGVKVWINGRLVHENHEHRMWTPDEDSFEADLREGNNRVLIKVDQGGGPWGFSFRIEDPRDEIEAVLPE